MNKKRLSVGSWNLCNGLCNKVPIVSQLLYQSDLDILFLQETEIPCHYDEKLLSIQGYVIEQCRSSDKKRLVAYIKSDIDYKRVDEDIDASVLLLTVNDSFDLD